MCYKTKYYAVCRRVRAFFSPEILQAEAVKGLKTSCLRRSTRRGMGWGGGGGCERRGREGVGVVPTLSTHNGFNVPLIVEGGVRRHCL